MKKDKSIVLSEEPVTRSGGLVVDEVEKSPVDRFQEEFGTDWPLELVRFGHDDGGRMIEAFVEESKANEFRTVCPSCYGPERIWTVVIGVDEGWGESKC